MGLFKALVRTVVNVAALPVDITLDAVTSIHDMVEDQPAHRTRSRIQQIKDEADTED